MVKNYFKTAFRNIIRHKTYTVINVLGLALGISACIVIYLFTSYEFSFDNFHPDGVRVYRITEEFRRPGGEKEFLNCITPGMAGMQYDITGFEAKAGIHFYNGKVSIPGNGGMYKEFEGERDIVITWPDYFKIFKYDWLAGDESTALSKPYQLVLTESNARKYFGTETFDQIIGSTVVYHDSLKVSVSGIVKDWTNNSDLAYKDFISIGTVTNSFLKKTIPTDDWSSLGPHRSMVFVELNRHTSAAQIDAQLAEYVKAHSKPNSSGTFMKVKLQPLSAIHFTDEYNRRDDGDNFRKAYLPTLYTLIGLALFILLIAVVNFINLSTAQSFHRSKEVGVRKVLGSNRRNIIFQFLTETAVLTFLAICIGVWSTEPILHLFSPFIPAGVTYDLFNFSTIIFLVILMLATSILAGIYPAKVLSSHLPAVSLRGTSGQAGMNKTNLRKALIVFQFTLSIISIIGAIVINRQISFMYNADRGFNSDAVVTIFNWGDDSGKMKVLRDKVKEISGVDNAIVQGTPPMGFAVTSAVFKFKGEGNTEIQVSTKMGDDDFIPFYRIKLACGRNIIHSDSLRELLINETLAKTLGFNEPKEALGKFLYDNDNRPYPIVGVTTDFQLGSFHELIKPVVIGHMPQWERSIAIQLATNGKSMSYAQNVISHIEQQWKELYPHTRFNYVFLDQYIAGLFRRDQQTNWLVNAAMIIAIFISCLGLFGLAMFTAEKRTKEIGIRKILGASTVTIIFMFTKEFAKWVLLANLFAWPVAYYIMNNWLQDFAYRITISWWMFILSGVIALAIALATVSFHAIKTATTNPVEALRYE